MTYATFHAPETSFGPHFNTFLAWVETRGHRASYEMYDVHDVHDLDRSGAGPISSPIHVCSCPSQWLPKRTAIMDKTTVNVARARTALVAPDPESIKLGESLGLGESGGGGQSFKFSAQ